MPSGPAELHKKWGDDGAAWAYLAERGFKHDRGIIAKVDRPLMDDEQSAIDYLFMEWDWAYQ